MPVRPPLPPLVVTRRTNQRIYAGLWAVSALPWVAAAALEGSAGFIVVATVWSLLAAASIADLATTARVEGGRLVAKRLGRERVAELRHARVRARRREISVVDASDRVVLRLYPDRDQVSVGKDPRPIPAAEIVDHLLARIDEAEAQGPGEP